MDGCPSTNQSLQSIVANPLDEIASTVNCCSDSGECSRKHEDRDACIFVPENDGPDTKYNYYGAEIACANEHKRLCTKDELLSSKAAGCCSSGCGEDHVLVWTKTVGNMTAPGYTGVPSLELIHSVTSHHHNNPLSHCFNSFHHDRAFESFNTCHHYIRSPRLQPN